MVLFVHRPPVAEIFRFRSLQGGIWAALFGHMHAGIRNPCRASWQSQKQKGNTAARKTITNDDIHSAPVPASPVLGEVSNSKVPAKPGASATPTDELARVESLVNKIDSMDRATLMKAVLEGVDLNFPGRSQWEQKMYAAKLAYVSQGRDLIQRAKQLSASAQSLQGNKNPDDPRVKDLTNKLKELVQNGTRADAAFQAVILEGRDLAGQSSPH